MLNKDIKQAVIKKNATTEQDTGSSHVQIALLSERIKQISGHLKQFPKDFHSRNGLLKLVCRRRKLLKYLGKKDPQGYSDLVASLGLRK